MPSELDDCIVLREIHIYRVAPWKPRMRGLRTKSRSLTASGGMGEGDPNQPQAPAQRTPNGSGQASRRRWSQRPSTVGTLKTDYPYIQALNQDEGQDGRSHALMSSAVLAPDLWFRAAPEPPCVPWL
jgi:hypothetical protein